MPSPISMNLSVLVKKYGGKWVALDKTSTKVVASDLSAKKVYKTAVNKGYDIPKLFKVPAKNIPYIG